MSMMGQAAVVTVLWLAGPLAGGIPQDHSSTSTRKDDDPVVTIRQLLRAGDYGPSERKLKDMGSSANDHYYAILQKTDIGQLELIRIFHLIQDQKGDRSRFLEFAQRELVNSDHYIRQSAASLLGELGSHPDAPRLAPLMSDADDYVRTKAAEALAKIGTAKEFPAMEKCLEVAARGNDPYQYADLKKARDIWKDRLDKAKAAPKK
jgi:hypothetical protein